MARHGFTGTVIFARLHSISAVGTFIYALDTTIRVDGLALMTYALNAGQIWPFYWIAYAWRTGWLGFLFID